MTKEQCINLTRIMPKKELYKSLNLLREAYPNKPIESNRTIGQWLREANKEQAQKRT